jgi:hypothetical protein
MSSGVATQEMVFLERRKACSIVCVDAAIVLVGVCVCVSADAMRLWTSSECVLHASSVLTLLSCEWQGPWEQQGEAEEVRL